MSQDAHPTHGLYGSPATAIGQRAALRSGEIPVAVYGLGKIGLPLATVFADLTGNTVGVDVDEAVVEAVAGGNSPVEREPGLAPLLEEVVEAGALQATTDGNAAAREAALHVIVVPTLVGEGGAPDLRLLDAVVETVGAGLSQGDLVVIESTVPPRTTADRVVPRLVETSDLYASAFGAAACPERTVSGRAIADIRGTHPKIVGGVDAESTRVARLVYEEVSDNEVLPAASATMAEAVKVFEGVYRDVNIAIANQLARYVPALDVDVREAIRLANTQPFCDILDPGPGVGGHCIPVYPYFLRAQFDVEDTLLLAARQTNDAMPAYTRDLLEAILDAHGQPLEGSSVLLLGLTYKANVAELRNAPALDLAGRLRDRGVAVAAADPLVEQWEDLPVERVTVEAAPSLDIDAIVLVTPHDEFLEFDWSAVKAPVLDGRDALDADAVDAPVYTLGDCWP